MATLWPEGMCIPYFTFPNVPYPIVLPRMKSPIFLVPAFASIVIVIFGTEIVRVL